MKILSADMATLPKAAIKKLVKKYVGADLTDDGAEELAKALERHARTIAKFAVKNAKKEKRSSVTKKDIQEYIFKKETSE